MARGYGLRGFFLLGALALATIAIGALSTATVGWPAFPRVITFEPSFSYSLADFSMPASDEIRLQATIAELSPLVKKDPATLDGMLRSIDIRTALEDTQRLRLDLG